MGWLRKRFNEPSSWAGLGTAAAPFVQLIPSPAVQMIAYGVIALVGGTAFVKADPGNR